LQIYQAPSKTNIWTNGDMQIGGPVAGADEAVPEVAVAGDESDDDYQVIAKKPKTVSEPAKTVTPNVPSSEERVDIETQNEVAQLDTEMGDVEESAAPEQGPVTDNDWLRSRTNRVLDLVEDDESPSSVTPAPAHKVEQAVLPRAPERSPEVEQQQEMPEVDESDVPTSAEVEKIRDTGRLYVRNLHFDVTEDDLRTHFSKYGSLEEVSNVHFSFSACLQ